MGGGVLNFNGGGMKLQSPSVMHGHILLCTVDPYASLSVCN